MLIFQFVVDKSKLLEVTDTTSEDFQAIYSSMHEIIMEPVRQKQLALQEAAETKSATSSSASTVGFLDDEADVPAPKRRKVSDEDEYARESDFKEKQNASAKSKAQASKAVVAVAQPPPHSVINEALNLDKMSTQTLSLH